MDNLDKAELTVLRALRFSRASREAYARALMELGEDNPLPEDGVAEWWRTVFGRHDVAIVQGPYRDVGLWESAGTHDPNRKWMEREAGRINGL